MKRHWWIPALGLFLIGFSVLTILAFKPESTGTPPFLKDAVLVEEKTDVYENPKKAIDPKAPNQIEHLKVYHVDRPFMDVLADLTGSSARSGYFIFGKEFDYQGWKVQVLPGKTRDFTSLMLYMGENQGATIKMTKTRNENLGDKIMAMFTGKKPKTHSPSTFGGSIIWSYGGTGSMPPPIIMPSPPSSPGIKSFTWHVSPYIRPKSGPTLTYP